MHITAYTALVEPRMGKLPVEESIESLYEHVDEFAILDCSKHDKIDLRRYGKVKKHVKGMWNPFHNPFGSMFTRALQLVDSDVALFLDIDEIFEFKTCSLRDILRRYPLDAFCGVSFWLRNYFCSRRYVFHGPPSKGAHVFRTEHGVVHGIVGGLERRLNSLRVVTQEPDACDGVRLVDRQGREMPDWRVSDKEVIIHHTSHLDPAAKIIRSFIQSNHFACLYVPEFYSYDMRPDPEKMEGMYEKLAHDAREGNLSIYTEVMPLEYKPNKLLDAFVDRVGYREFYPRTLQGYDRYATLLPDYDPFRISPGPNRSTRASVFTILGFYSFRPRLLLKRLIPRVKAIIPSVVKARIRRVLSAVSGCWR